MAILATENADACLAGGGEAGALMRAIDWSKTPLGPVSGWPTTLRTTVGIMLASRFAMRVLWGPEYVMLHNDAYRPVLGASKYPRAMGSRTAESFAEVWDVVGPMFRRVMAGETVALDDRVLPLDRNGYLEECYFTLSYSPLSDDRGGIGGVLGVIYETTRRVLGERRLRALRQLAATVSVERTPPTVCAAASLALAGAPEDVPFVLLYLGDREPRLAARAGLDAQPSARPSVVHLHAGAKTWPLAPPAAGARCWRVDDLVARFGELHGGPYPEVITSAIVLALQRPGASEPYGYLVAGINPRRALDADYEAFFELAGEHITAALANATAIAHEDAERARLRSFLLEAPAAIAVLRGPQITFELANEGYCRLIGRRSEDLIGKPLRAALPEVAQQGVVEVLEKVFATGETFKASEFPVLLDRKGNGTAELCYFDWIAQATRDGGGAIDGLMGFAVEVTEQVLARRSADASRTFLEAVVKQMPAGIFIAEAPSGKVLLSNALSETILGQVTAPPESIDQYSKYAPLHVDGRPYAPTELPLARALSGELVRDEEVMLALPGGSRRTLLVSAAPVYDDAARLVAGVSSFLDISERKRTELALRDSEERGRAIVAALEEGIVLRGSDGTIRFANASAERLLGVTANAIATDALRRGQWETIREDGSTYTASEQPPTRALREGRAFSGEVVGLRRPDGTTLWLSVNVQPLFDAEGSVSGAVSSFFDITQRKAADEERQTLLARAESARSAAEAANRAKDEFLAIVSHELRNPLNAMLGWTRLLRTGSLSDERAARALETIERNATNQAQLIEDLLDVSRVVAGKLPLDVQTASFARVVEAAIDSARPAIDAKGLRLSVDLDSEGVLFGDPGRLQQIVWNLLTNATKFTPRDGSIDVVLARDDAYLELSVTDSGQGIDPSFLGLVFDRFMQADPSTTRKHGGLGLGLAITKSLVEMHGGTIEARSDGLEKGATFVVRLPAAAMRRPDGSPRAPRALALPVALDCPAELRDLRVLVVDDEDDAREIVTAVLAECGVRVSTARSAAHAMEEFDAAIPDVLLSDIGMPEEDGYTLIARIRALPHERGGSTPAACLTGYTTVDDRRKALSAGFNMHLAKPIEPSELIAVVANLARMSRVLRAGP